MSLGRDRSRSEKLLGALGLCIKVPLMLLAIAVAVGATYVGIWTVARASAWLFQEYLRREWPL